MKRSATLGVFICGLSLIFGCAGGGGGTGAAKGVKSVYKLKLLDPPDAVSAAFGINDLGTIVGYMEPDGGPKRAVAWNLGTNVKDLGTLGGKSSWANGIASAANIIVGGSETAGGAVHAFKYTGSGPMVDVGTLPGAQVSEAFAVNTQRAVGRSGDGAKFRACWFGTGGVQPLPGPIPSEARGLQPANGITGGFVHKDPHNHAVAWTDGYIDLGTLGGPSSICHAIGHTEKAVGQADRADGSAHAFVISVGGGPMRDLGTLGGRNSIAYAINKFDVIVGASDVSGDPHTHAFIWINQTMHDLNKMVAIPPDVVLIEARGINSNGQIVGIAKVNGRQRAFLLY
jgi:probable HAF family extracellular repeat protein